MSRTSHKQQRLRLFKQGNDRCPICLTSFTVRDVEQGTMVTLEHVPPKSFEADSIAMCLTCSDCNNSTSRVEQEAVKAKQEPKARIQIPGLPDHTGQIVKDASGHFQICMLKSRVSRDEMIKVMDAPRLQMEVSFKMPNPHYVIVPWLKAAYLSVFSLLGVYGYRYARGEAVERVRKQIMNPEDEFIRRFAFSAPSTWRGRDGIVMNRRQTPCWVVKMGDCIVFLPRSWDRSLYEVLDSMPSPNFKVHVGGPLWYPLKFGDQRVGSIAFQEGYHPSETPGEDLFGLLGQWNQSGKVASFYFADCSGQEVTVIVTKGLRED